MPVGNDTFVFGGETFGCSIKLCLRIPLLPSPPDSTSTKSHYDVISTLKTVIEDSADAIPSMDKLQQGGSEPYSLVDVTKESELPEEAVNPVSGVYRLQLSDLAGTGKTKPGRYGGTAEITLWHYVTQPSPQSLMVGPAVFEWQH